MFNQRKAGAFTCMGKSEHA